MGIYLDYNSSAPIDHRVLEYMIEIYKGNIGNSDSRTHDYGESARKIVENARKQVAEILNIKSEEVFFTSGATESNNIAIHGLWDYAKESGKNHIITSAIEHKAVLETCKYLEKNGFKVDYIFPDISGRIKLEQIKNLINDKTLLVSIMHVNNETGIIQPIEEIGDYLYEKNILFHIDATQSFGKLVDELKNTKYDMMSLSAHKFGGPQGVGALILKKKKYKLPPIKSIYFGGQQEHGLRPGTVPVALVAGLGKACEIANDEYKCNEEKCKRIKEKIMEIIEQSGINYSINGSQKNCISSTLNICLNGVSSEALMLSSKQLCGISNGSACNSKSYKPSYVLSAMGIKDSLINNSIRISWGHEIEIEEIEKNITGLLEIAKNLVW